MASRNRDTERAVSYARPSYRLLTEEQIQDLHNATMEILETVGIRVLNEEGLRLLQDAGCRIKNGNLALIPEALVQSCIESAPSAVMIYNRKGQEAMQLTGRNSYFGIGTGLITTLDLVTGETLTTVLQDVVNAARVADACPEVDFIASLGLGMLLSAARSLHSRGARTVIVIPRPLVLKVLEAAQMPRVIPIVSSVSGAEALLNGR